MREAEFREWLSRRRYQGKELTTINQRLNWCRAVERALPELGFSETDLDALHDGSRWAELLTNVSKLRSDWRSNEAAARVIAPQSENPAGQMANARASIGLYGRFADGDDPNYDSNAETDPSPMTGNGFLDRFTKKAEFADWFHDWSDSDRSAFLRIVRMTHDAGLDWYHLKMSREVRCGRKKVRAVDANEVYARIAGKAPSAHVRKAEDREALGIDNWISLAAFADALDAAPDALDRFSIGRQGYWPDEVNPDPPVSAMSESPTDPVAAQPTNLILYGPPGTGKTYATAAEAVRLCDGLDANDPLLRDADMRGELRRRYDQLVEAGQVRLITFHQNYSYEEFVEGLRPVTESGSESDEGANGAGFRLEPKRGIFREICSVAENARKNAGRSGGFDLAGRKLFKMSLGRAGVDEHIFDAAIEGNYAVLGWGGDVDWSDPRYDEWSAIFERWQEENPDATGNDPNVVQMWPFRSAMKEGDLVIVSAGNSHFRAIGEVTGPYRFEPTDTRDYNHRRPVRWLLVPDEPLPTEMIYGKKFMMQSCYQLKDALVNKDALARLLPGGDAQSNGTPDQFVLIIDEINRANISKVFGELITLIEPDKRLGAGPEALTARLPYSGEAFGVPANLHIVGTMNTADRSIAALDTALRRRFAFREVAPDPSVLPEDVDGVPLRRVLQTMNDRIEYLIDREHRIGHAFFLGKGGIDRPAINTAMRDKVIPLLQEYFFEDWSRVAAVLGEPQGKGGGFLDCRKLRDPTGQDGEERESWSVRPEFAFDAYDRLIGKPPSAAPAEPDAPADEALDEAAE
jgi:hypothetical protein